MTWFEKMFRGDSVRGAKRLDGIVGMVERTMEEIDLSEKEMAEEQEQNRVELNEIGKAMAERSTKMVRAAKIKANLKKFFK